MSTLKVESDGTATTLDGRTSPDEVVTAEDVKDADKVARLLGKLLKDNADLRRRWNPQRIDFEDVTVSTAGAVVQLQHNFSARVRWWVIGWQSAASTSPDIREDTTNTTSSTLVLKSYVAGTACVRVEEAG